ncbi:MAG: MarR family transcriptional regulator [Lachnospiraceae bacterium]|nr:MarR family transcriptional regulator [Lachnospiraceae bacterium]
MKNNETCIQNDIVKMLHIDKSYLSRIMKRFCQKGLVEKIKSNNDKKATKITLTQTGKAETEHDKETFEKIDKKMKAEAMIFFAVENGVALDSLALGEKSQITKMNYAAGKYASLHKHPNEQSGYAISGRYELILDGKNTNYRQEILMQSPVI